MLGRVVTAVGVCAFIAAKLASHVHAFSEPIPTKIGLQKPERLWKLVAKPTAGEFPIPNCLDSNPISLGGELAVTKDGATLTCALPAADWDQRAEGGWKVLGKCEGAGDTHNGFKFLNKSAPANHPCKVIVIKEKVIKILAKDDRDLAAPSVGGTNGETKIELAVGNDSYCSQWGVVGGYFKEIGGKLVKEKDEPAPAACEKCGNNMINGDPPEECDGTADSACTCQGVGLCLPPGDPNECTCAPAGCGNNCRETEEQCDGIDSDECAGLCLANCTCPEPICNNGVKEVGEECDPSGSMADCPVGEICGGFCKCVPDVACTCGSPEPTLFTYRNAPPDYDGEICGTTDGTTLTVLECMGLYIGGGGGALPVPNKLLDQAETKFSIDQCVGTDITLRAATRAEVGPRHCSEGKRCVGGDSDSQPCIRDGHCPLGTCEPRCWYGSYLPILHMAVPALSPCISNEIVEDCSGGVDCATGKAVTRISLDSVPHLTLADQSPSTPGHNGCPICVGGTLDVADSGTCEGGPNNGLPCMPMSTSYDLWDCCATGANAHQPCSNDSDCPGSECLTGCTVYPTSLDCPPHPLTAIGRGLLYEVQLNTENADAYKNTVWADENGNFCGWCRDVEVEGSGCFEGNPDEGPPAGASGCPDSAVIACRPETYHGPGGGDPADIADCGDSLSCRTNADCTAPYETCSQRSPGAWRDATIREVIYDGASRPGDLRDKLPHASTIVSNFCIPPSFDDIVDGNSDLGGPGGISLKGAARLSPSGAFMDVRTW